MTLAKGHANMQYERVYRMGFQDFVAQILPQYGLYTI